MELYDMDLNNLESSNLIASLPEEKKQVYIKVIIQELDRLPPGLWEKLSNDIENMINQYLKDEGYKRYED